jgi:hypothetical protein
MNQLTASVTKSPMARWSVATTLMCVTFFGDFLFHCWLCFIFTVSYWMVPLCLCWFDN